MQQVYVGIGGAFSFNETYSEQEYFKEKAEVIKKKRTEKDRLFFSGVNIACKQSLIYARGSYASICSLLYLWKGYVAAQFYCVGHFQLLLQRVYLVNNGQNYGTYRLLVKLWVYFHGYDSCSV